MQIFLVLKSFEEAGKEEKEYRKSEQWDYQGDDRGQPESYLAGESVGWVGEAGGQ